MPCIDFKFLMYFVAVPLGRWVIASFVTASLTIAVSSKKIWQLIASELLIPNAFSYDNHLSSVPLWLTMACFVVFGVHVMLGFRLPLYFTKQFTWVTSSLEHSKAQPPERKSKINVYTYVRSLVRDVTMLKQAKNKKKR
jgi:hypothetical protein